MSFLHSELFLYIVIAIAVISIILSLVAIIMTSQKSKEKYQVDTSRELMKQFGIQLDRLFEQDRNVIPSMTKIFEITKDSLNQYEKNKYNLMKDYNEKNKYNFRKAMDVTVEVINRNIKEIEVIRRKEMQMTYRPNLDMLVRTIINILRRLLNTLFTDASKYI